MKTAENTCKICDTTFTHEVKKGRVPSLCGASACISENRRLTRKPKTKVVREHKCSDCDTLIVQAGKGRTILRCRHCKAKLRVKQNAAYRAETFIPLERAQTCKDCGCDLGNKVGRGKLKLRCADCQKKNHNKLARESAKKHYTPVVRNYVCSICDILISQSGRGKLRKTCPDCIKNNVTGKHIVGLPVGAHHYNSAGKLLSSLQEEADEHSEMWEGMSNSE
tara:strand:- start:9759 stop:10424 length:666 start_codon:yes stop_codon:yes gene_type:complete